MLSPCSCAHPRLAALDTCGLVLFFSSQAHYLLCLTVLRSFVCFCVLAWKYFWKYLSSKSIDFCSSYFSFHLNFFQLPLPHPLWFLPFPPTTPPPFWGAERAFINLKWWGHSWPTRFGHSLTCCCRPCKWHVAVPYVHFILNVALKFSVLCVGCCMSLQMNV